jgi:hypothetical protein
LAQHSPLFLECLPHTVSNLPWGKFRSKFWAELEQFRNTRRLFERIAGWLFLDEKAT